MYQGQNNKHVYIGQIWKVELLLMVRLFQWQVIYAPAFIVLAAHQGNDANNLLIIFQQ